MEPETKPLGRLGRFWDRVLSGPMPTDPLYVSNRTLTQKLVRAGAVGVPLAIVLGAVVYTLFSPAPTAEVRYSEPTAAEVAARNPIVPKDFKVDQGGDLQLVEVGVDRSALPHHVTGLVRNISNLRLGGAELQFDLTDQQGSHVGSATALVDEIAPHGTVRFATAIPQKNVASVLVREMRSTLRRRP
jgi:hypothetical protein